MRAKKTELLALAHVERQSRRVLARTCRWSAYGQQRQ
jgi:hypothetical protein